MRQIKQTIKFGDSVGFVIPKFIAEQLKIKPKSHIVLEYNEESKYITISKE